MATSQQRTLKLARLADHFFDEHGSTQGDYNTTKALDYVPPKKAELAPFMDMGGRGLGLIEITHKRVYSKSYRFYGFGWAKSRYVVGRNEAGTYFSHEVTDACDTVIQAIQWIWSDRGLEIVQRQGDIALIIGRGPKMPSNIPWGHQLEGQFIVHETHPPLPLPQKGQRVIVGRRAIAYVSHASRD